MEEETKVEVTITYETLFELLRREKEKSELQKLDSTFFNNVLRYLKDKKAIITQQQADTSSMEEKAKIEEQLINVKKIIREFYDRREKKIVTMAIDKSKNKSSIVDNSVFLKQEKELFESIVKILSTGRENVLFNIIDLKEPLSLGGINLSEGVVQDSPTPVVKEEKKKDTKLVRFLNAVPKFVGKELEEYGPFEEEDIASLPVEIATVLINKQRVEEISED
jgi:DNA replication initiation complex subunit (GINS family)